MELSELYNRTSKLRCLDKFDHTPENDGAILVGIFIGMANCNLNSNNDKLTKRNEMKN